MLISSLPQSAADLSTCYLKTGGDINGIINIKPTNTGNDKTLVNEGLNIYRAPNG
jgi:hypothetical protein